MSTLKTGDVIHGFKLNYSQPLEEIKAVLHRFTYLKNGADAIWLERDDDNKSFAISFKTVPDDDTGVFHILEHSVLNGSEKYPLREPFVELLKSSLATFLNAMTAPDMTIYPVSSRNDKDFLNLMDVYLDAVLHPLSLKDPNSFRQEGWHYELESPEGELSVNGVVFNEMKGAYTSSDELIRDRLNRLMFPDTCYGKDSGGDPDHIPELTYESYLAKHRRFYHPSNSYIFLDGKVDLDSAFGKIDSFLKDYDKINPDSTIAIQTPVQPDEQTSYYPIGTGEDESNKAYLGRGWVYGMYNDYLKNLAVTVLNEALAGSNEAPLSKALLEAGLCEDISLEKSSGGMQTYVKLIIKNCDPANKDEIWALTEKVFNEQAQGLDHRRLMSVLSHIEFLNREKDFGGISKGLVYGLDCMDSWLYGGDPAEALCKESLFEPLRRMVDEGGFEKLLKEIYIDGQHRAQVTMLPSKTIANEKREAEKQRLSKYKDSLSSDEIERIISEFKALRLRQNTPDTPEQLKSLPKLGIEDIPKNRTKVPSELKQVAGVPVLHQNVDASGISYVSLNFSLDDLSYDELSRASILATLLGSIETENLSVTELDTLVDENLGRFNVMGITYTGKKGMMPLLSANFAVLGNHKQDAVKLIDEVLNRSKFTDEKYILNLIRQSRMDMEQAAMMGGNMFAVRHASASINAGSALREAMNGMGLLRTLQKEEKSFSADTLEWLKQLKSRLISRDRLTISLTGEMDEEFISQLASAINSVPKGEKIDYKPIDRSADAIVIPSEIGFGAMCAPLSFESKGAALVAAQYLTYDYLWNTIRVKGGAYGTSFRVTDSGLMEISSYRDPNAANSLESFKRCGEILKQYALSGEDITQYIVSTIGNIDPLRTPRSIGPDAEWMHYTNTTELDREQEWQQVLATTAQTLSNLGEEIDKAAQTANICLIGGQTSVDACKDRFDKIENLQ